MNGNRARAALIIAAIAVGSALAGAGVNHWLMVRDRHGRGGPSRVSTPEQDARRRREMLDHMTKDLDLSAAQRAGIDSVMQRTDSALRAVRSEMQPRLKQIFETSRTEIAARLDSTQRIKFDALNKKRARR